MPSPVGAEILEAPSAIVDEAPEAVAEDEEYEDVDEDGGTTARLVMIGVAVLVVLGALWFGYVKFLRKA
jgi:hypothetical protein